MNKAILIIIICLLAAAVVAAVAVSNRASKSGNEKYVAFVNGNGILREDFRKEYAAMSSFYQQTQPSATVPASLKQDTLTILINKRLVMDFARKNNITVSGSEIEQAYRAILNNGKIDEARYLEKISGLYGIDKNTHLQELGYELLREKVQARLGKDITAWLKTERQKTEVEVVSAL